MKPSLAEIALARRTEEVMSQKPASLPGAGERDSGPLEVSGPRWGVLSYPSKPCRWCRSSLPERGRVCARCLQYQDPCPRCQKPIRIVSDDVECGCTSDGNIIHGVLVKYVSKKSNPSRKEFRYGRAADSRQQRRGKRRVR